jgi:hypothetical protein
MVRVRVRTEPPHVRGHGEYSVHFDTTQSTAHSFQPHARYDTVAGHALPPNAASTVIERLHVCVP